MTYWGRKMKQDCRSSARSRTSSRHGERSSRRTPKPLERLAKRAGMTPQDAARLAMNLAPLPARNGAVYHATACTERRCRPLDREAPKRPMNASQLWAELHRCPSLHRRHPADAGRTGRTARTGTSYDFRADDRAGGHQRHHPPQRRAPGDLRDEPQCGYAHRRTRSSQGCKGTLPARS